jgi:hypothetical protein
LIGFTNPKEHRSGGSAILGLLAIAWPVLIPLSAAIALAYLLITHLAEIGAVVRNKIDSKTEKRKNDR